MKKLLLSFALLTTCLMVDAQDNFREIFFLTNTSVPVIENTVRYNSSAQAIERIYKNNDYCSYMVVRKGARYYNAVPGENVFESRPSKTQTAMNNFAKTDVRIYRGIFPKKPDSLYHYALPFPAHREVHVKEMLQRLRERREPYYSFRSSGCDTVYAMRGGVACISGDKRGLIINHIDETFAVYSHFVRTFVKAGDPIEVGQAIGLAAGYQVNVTFLYLDSQFFKNSETAEQYPYTHFSPMLWNGTSYVRVADDLTLMASPLTPDLITQDMSKAERKRWLKKHGIK